MKDGCSSAGYGLPEPVTPYQGYLLAMPRAVAPTSALTFTVTSQFDDPSPIHPRLATFGKGLLKKALLAYPKRLPFHILEEIMREVNDLGSEMRTSDLPSSNYECKDFILYSMKIEVNGCGPRGWKRGVVRRLDKPWWMFGKLTLRKACIGHDILYAIGGDEIDRMRSDNWLHDDIVWRCRRRFTSMWSGALKAVGYVTASGFLAAVRRGGTSSFNNWRDSYEKKEAV